MTILKILLEKVAVMARDGFPSFRTKALQMAAAAADKLPFRKNKKAAVKMQREKKDLKADLSRIRASVGEAAAGAEAEKERKAEILKNMDPAEQERIIREVLKEFLS